MAGYFHAVLGALCLVVRYAVPVRRPGDDETWPVRGTCP